MKANNIVLVVPVIALLLTACREPNSSQIEAASSGQQSSAETGPLEGQASNGPSGRREPATLCNIESLNTKMFGSEAMAVTGPTRVRGWLGDEAGGDLGNPSLVLADESKAEVASHPLQLKLKRPDVVSAFPGKIGLENAGFEVVVDSSRLKPGIYHMYLTYSTRSREYACDNGRHVRVRG